jgi:hypothetical protein
MAAVSIGPYRHAGKPVSTQAGMPRGVRGRRVWYGVAESKSPGWPGRGQMGRGLLVTEKAAQLVASAGKP